MTAPVAEKAAGKAIARRESSSALATGRHRAEGPATGRHRAAPATRPHRVSPVKEARTRVTGGQSSPRVGGTTTGAGRPGGNIPRYTPRSSRTRYIRYIGNQDASNTGKLVTEWLAGVVLISIAVPTQGADHGYQKVMTTIMYRLTALTAVFFVLALMANSKAGRVAVYVGLLIDLGLVFTTYREGTLKKSGDLIAGRPVSTGANTTGGGGTAVPQANIFPPAQAVSGGFVDLTGGTSGSSGNPAVPA